MCIYSYKLLDIELNFWRLMRTASLPSGLRSGILLGIQKCSYEDTNDVSSYGGDKSPGNLMLCLSSKKCLSHQ